MSNKFGIPLGMLKEEVYSVDEAATISEVDARLPKALATYVMIKWMEMTAGMLIQEYLPDTYISVGIKVNVNHISMTPVGGTVRVKAQVVAVEGNLAELNVEAFDESGKIGYGSHSRTVIPLKLVERQLNAKVERSPT